MMCSLISAPALWAADPAPPTSSAITAELPGDFLGMVVRDPHYEWNTNPNYVGTNKAFYDAMGENLRDLGVKWVRIEFFAEDGAPAAGQPDLRGRVDTAKYSYFINTVAPKYGLKVIGLLATPLVRQRPEGATIRYPGVTYAPGAYITPEAIEAPLTVDSAGNGYGFVNPYMYIWLDNAVSVARAFPYNAATGAGVAAFEVLNEENRYLNGGGKGMKPDSVATLLTKFYRSYKNVECPAGRVGSSCTSVSILVGGLHPDRCDDCVTGQKTDRQYLDAIYKSGAFASYKSIYNRLPLDGVGYHPYPLEMRSGLLPEPTGATDLFRIPQRISDMRQVMLNNQDSASRLWITEIGDRGNPRDPDNQARQAQFLHTVYWTLWQQRAFIQTVLWFKYEDFAVPGDPNANGPENWGVVRLAPRPASQLCPQQVPPEQQTCEYDMTGAVDTFKQSYGVYKAMAQTGAGLETYQYYMPVITKGEIVAP
jgi:hypothetical protein